MALVIAASVIAYITTEMDDLLLLLVLFSRAKNKTERTCIIVGKYIGLALVVCCCTMFAVYISKVPSKYIGLLGFVPIVIGVRSLFEKKNDDEDANADTPLQNTNSFPEKILFVAETVVMTLASSGDNIAVYIPFFTSLHGFDFLAMSIVFIVMQALWCILSLLVCNAKQVRQFNQQFYRIIIPVLFFSLGIYILIKDGTFLWIFGK